MFVPAIAINFDTSKEKYNRDTEARSFRRKSSVWRHSQTNYTFRNWPFMSGKNYKFIF